MPRMTLSAADLIAKALEKHGIASYTILWERPGRTGGWIVNGLRLGLTVREALAGVEVHKRELLEAMWDQQEEGVASTG